MLSKFSFVLLAITQRPFHKALFEGGDQKSKSPGNRTTYPLIAQSEEQMSMEIFYRSLFDSNQRGKGILPHLLHIARASLKDVLAVRSDLAWGEWDGSTN
jgi:hypothetical protein